MASNSRNLLDIVLLFVIAYIFFPKYSNIFSFLFKLLAWLIITIMVTYLVSNGLDKLVLYFKKNRLHWLRKSFDSRENVKNRTKSTSIVQNSVIFFINTWISRKSIFYNTLYYSKNNPLETIILLLMVGFTISLIFLFL